eukprot:scaffold3359_cov123-Cylindrotheca_fusiformis.AAC.28
MARSKSSFPNRKSLGIVRGRCGAWQKCYELGEWGFNWVEDLEKMNLSLNRAAQSHLAQSHLSVPNCHSWHEHACRAVQNPSTYCSSF